MHFLQLRVIRYIGVNLTAERSVAMGFSLLESHVQGTHTTSVKQDAAADDAHNSPHSAVQHSLGTWDSFAHRPYKGYSCILWPIEPRTWEIKMAPVHLLLLGAATTGADKPNILLFFPDEFRWVVALIPL